MKWIGITACFSSHLIAPQGLPAGEGITDPRDNPSRVVNQYAVHEAASKVTAVVPDLVLAEAGHYEEIRGHPSVDNV